MASSITQVWSSNFEQELINLDVALRRYPVASIDSEFPGCALDTPRDASDLERYSDLRFNVNPTRPIQLGITLTDKNGTRFLTWEFNFQFKLDRDEYVSGSIRFLKENGIDFKKLESDGISICFFAHTFGQIVRKHRDLQWVTFHGLYDFAYALKLVIQNPLPDSVLDFAALLGNIFGKVIDIKYMAKFCVGLRGGELGLERMARILGVHRLGGAHQAGSDSLLTAQAFIKMKMMYNVHESIYEGFLYSMGSKIHKNLVLIRSPIPYCYPQFTGRSYNAVFPQPYMIQYNHLLPVPY